MLFVLDQWQSWNAWSDCSKTCGSRSTRERICSSTQLVNGPVKCKGRRSQSRRCKPWVKCTG